MIDFRSDTVTQPTIEMRRAMADAPVGDDVYGDDPTIAHLQRSAAERMGTEAALFCTSGTQANLLALMSHCGRGDEYICGLQAHNFKYEQGGAAVLGSIQPQPVVNQADGSLAIDDIRAVIKPDDVHFARTKLVSVENTIGGRVLPMNYWPAIQQLCHSQQLALHIDGARLFNASVQLGVDIQSITRHVDTFTICLSKGLAAPVGALLFGSKDFIQQATRIRKMLGGGWRQAGILAAAGQIAFDVMPERLSDDHVLAHYLAKRLTEIDEFEVDPLSVQTNMVYARCMQGRSRELQIYLQSRDILIFGGDPIRFVTHLDVNQASVDTLIKGIKDFYTRSI
ncbi:low-specificity L-threonine aldolase [Celerinatantimonas yamalensis]|uniref:Low-specificity L-threonine aldolase n=1 Tax=Celerinatantimonas yamalensis TaxID=559956 RepID=A0ABW9G8T9_9GAMM